MRHAVNAGLSLCVVVGLLAAALLSSPAQRSSAFSSSAQHAVIVPVADQGADATAVEADADTRRPLRETNPLLESMESSLTSGVYHDLADFNGDGVVNASDLMIWRSPKSYRGGSVSDSTATLALSLEADETNAPLLLVKLGGQDDFRLQAFTLGFALEPGDGAAGSAALLEPSPLIGLKDGDASYAATGETGAMLTVTGEGIAGPSLLSLRVAVSDDAAGRFAVTPLRPSVLVAEPDGAEIPVRMPTATLIVRTAGDRDGDGLIGEQDLLNFLAVFDAKTPANDLTGDGRVDGLDVLQMLEWIGEPTLDLEIEEGSSSPVGRLSERILPDREAAERAEAEADSPEPIDGDGPDGPDGPTPLPGGGSSTLDGVDSSASPSSSSGVGGSSSGPRSDLRPGDRSRDRGRRGRSTDLPQIIDVSPRPESISNFGPEELFVTFDEPVTIPADAIRIVGTTSSMPIPVVVDYDAATRTARLLPQEPLTAGRFAIIVDYTVTDADGFALDGEVVDPTEPALPSGDGVQGGQAVFAFAVLQGDINQDGVVDGNDQGLLLSDFGETDSPADLNGDGIVDGNDQGLLLSNFNAQLPPSDGEPLEITALSPGADQTFVAAEVASIVVNFDLPVKSASITPTSLYAILPDGTLQPSDYAKITNGGTAVSFGFAPGLPAGETYEIRLSNAISDLAGDVLPLDGRLDWTLTLEEPPPPLLTDQAEITGKVFDITTGEPLVDAFVEHHIAEGYQEGDPPLPGVVKTNAQGEFRLTTIPFEGQETFFVRVFKPDFAEAVRVVDAVAGRTQMVRDSSLNPLNPPQMLTVDEGGMLMDDMGGGMMATLEVPPGALKEDSEISFTVLEGADAIRDRMPRRVAEQGLFVDIGGVFGDETDMPVTLTVPNTYNLPVGAEVRFGKISHEDGSWTDLRTPFGADPPDDPNDPLGIGIVIPDGNGGTVIEVTFDNFCTICTQYCLNEQAPLGADESGDPANGGQSSSPSEADNICGDSTVNIPEGWLWEELSLPGFRELGSSWGVRLGYASYAASPSVTLRGRVSYPSPNNRPVEATTFRFEIEGQEIAAVFERSTTSDTPTGTFIWDGTDELGDPLPTGSYEYTFEAISFYADAQVAVSDVFGGPPVQAFNATFPDLAAIRTDPIERRAIVVNESESDYGAGWRVLNESRLHFDPDGCIVLVFGNSEYRLFVPDDDNPDLFLSPAGEFSTLVRRADGTYLREFNSGATELYSPLGRLLRQEDRYGYVTTFAYDDANRLATIVSPVGNLVRFMYDGNGHLDRVMDSAGRVTDFTVDAQGHLVEMTNAVGSTRFFNYAADGRLIGQQGARGERTEYIYNEDAGRIVATEAYDTDGTTLLRRREYGPSVLVNEIGAALAAGQGTFDEPLPIANNRVDTYTDGRGATTEYIMDARGNVSRIVDALGREVSFTYDDRDLLASRTRPDGSVTNYEYNDDGDLTKITEQFNGAEVEIAYDGPFSLPTTFEDPLDNTTEIVYLSNGNIERVIDAENWPTVYYYDDPRFPNLPTRIENALNDFVTIDYDTRGNVASITDQLSRRSEFVYDLAGNLEEIVEPRGFSTTYGYDELNRLRFVTDPENNTTELRYQESGCGCSSDELTEVVLANGSSVAFEYDGLGRVVLRRDQGGREAEFDHDPEGALTSFVRRTGVELVYDRDAIGRVIAVRNDDAGTVLAAYEYDVLGNLESAVTPETAVTREYDSLSRLIEETQAVFLPPTTGTTGGPGVNVSSTLEYGYDLANRLTTRTALGATDTLSYDARGILNGVTVTGLPPGTLAWSMDIDELGRRRAISHPNGLTQTIVYDAASQIRSMTLTRDSDSTVLDELLYPEYFANGQLRRFERNTLGQESFGYEYEYGPTGRLGISLRSTTPPAADAELQSVAYSEDGRIDTVDGLAADVDQSGRLEKLSVGFDREFEFDELDRLRSFVDRGAGGSELASVHYFYDAFGRRLASRVNGSIKRTVYSGWNKLAVSKSDGRQVARIVAGTSEDDRFGAWQFENDSFFSLHADRLRTTVLAADENGSTVFDQAFSPSGTILRMTHVEQASSLLPSFGFTGLSRDIESSLTHARARYLSATLSAFITEDPIGLVAGPSLYSYALGDPVSLVDRRGEAANFVTGAVGALVGGAVEAFNIFVLERDCERSLGDVVSRIAGGAARGAVVASGAALVATGVGAAAGTASLGARAAQIGTGAFAGVGIDSVIGEQFFGEPPITGDDFGREALGGAIPGIVVPPKIANSTLGPLFEGGFGFAAEIGLGDEGTGADQ